jgi:hypothetical protein
MTILNCGSHELKERTRQLRENILEGSSSIHERTRRVKEFIDRCRQLTISIASPSTSGRGVEQVELWSERVAVVRVIPRLCQMCVEGYGRGGTGVGGGVFAGGAACVRRSSSSKRFALRTSISCCLSLIACCSESSLAFPICKSV